MDRRSYSVEITADDDGLRRLYDFVADVALYLDLEEKCKFDIELAVEEAVNNIIHYAYDRKGGLIGVTITYMDGEIVVTIQDWGTPFDGVAPEFDYNKPVSDRINGGMGLHFIRTVMDSVTFEPQAETGTILTLTKKCLARPAEASQVRDELEVLVDVSRALSSTHSVNEVLELIVGKLTQVVEADRGTLYLIDEALGELYSIVLNEDSDRLREIRLKLGEGLAGHVAATGETVNVRSVQDDSRWSSIFDARSGYQTRNMICTPLLDANHKIIGALQLINKKKGHFTSRDESMLRVLASQAAIAYENARLIEAEKSKRYLADTLREVAAIINSALDLNKTLALILEQLQRVIYFKNASILLIDDGDMVVKASRGEHAHQIMSEPIFRAEESDIYKEMVESRQPVIIPDIHNDHRWVRLETTANMHAFLGTPLGTGADVIGELTVIVDEPNYYTEEHAEILKAFADQASAAIERARLYEQSIQQARIRQELETAYRIQSSFLPREIPHPEGWEIAASWQPAREVGGDFYDFLPFDDGRIGFLIADVSGKGVPAALFMALARAIFRTLALGEEIPLPQLMGRVNNGIQENNRARFFVTLFYGVLNPVTGDLEVVNAGHNPPLHISSTRTVSISNGGPALGLFPDLTFEGRKLTVQHGDIFAFYTDGITEAINADEEEFGEKRLKNCLQEHRQRSAQEIVNTIHREVKSFVGDEPPFDDATLVVIKRKE